MKKFYSLMLIFVLSFFALNAQPVVNIQVIGTTTTTVTASFTPNAACTSYSILMSDAATMNMYVQWMQCSLGDLVDAWGISCPNDTVYTWTEMTPATEYTIYVQAHGATAADTTLYTYVVSTASAGGEGTSVITINVTEISDTCARVICTPNDQTAVFYDGIVTKELYDEVGVDSIKQIIKASPYPQYSEDNWLWMTLDANTEYYAVAIGKNANDVWGDLATYFFSTLASTAIEEIENRSFTCYPNPAENFVNVSTTFNADKAEIINLLGQVVYTESVAGNNFSVNVSTLAKGTYILRLSNDNTFATQKLIKR